MISKTIQQTYAGLQDILHEQPKIDTDLLAVIETAELSLCLLRKLDELAKVTAALNLLQTETGGPP